MNSGTRLRILVWMIIAVGLMLEVSGCDYMDILGFAGLERHRYRYRLWVHVHSSLNNRPIHEAKVYLRACIFSRETSSKIRDTDLIKDEVTDKEGRTNPWEFEYDLLYDCEEKRYLEYVWVHMFVMDSDPAPGGSGVDVVRGLGRGHIIMHPGIGVYSDSIAYSVVSDPAPSGVLSLTKITAWLPVQARSQKWTKMLR